MYFPIISKSHHTHKIISKTHEKHYQKLIQILYHATIFAFLSSKANVYYIIIHKPSQCEFSKINIFKISKRE